MFRPVHVCKGVSSIQVKTVLAASAAELLTRKNSMKDLQEDEAILRLTQRLSSQNLLTVIKTISKQGKAVVGGGMLSKCYHVAADEEAATALQEDFTISDMFCNYKHRNQQSCWMQCCMPIHGMYDCFSQ